MADQDYIFGTKDEELDRLAFQHRVWMKETHNGWRKSEVKSGMTVLDIGSGPGFTSIDLSYIVGSQGKVIAIDQSSKYTEFLNRRIEELNLDNIEIITSDIDNLDIPENSVDFAYSRWVMSWVSDPKSKINKIKSFLKDDAKFLLHEYNNWHSLYMSPECESFNRIRQAALEGWKYNDGEVNIARYLPDLLNDLNFNINSISPLSSIGRPGNLIWQWVTSFLKIYSKILIERGLMSDQDLSSFKSELKDIETNPASYIFGPQMLEIISQK